MTPTFDLTRDHKGRLVLHRPGLPDVHDVRVRRAFPLTHDNTFISVRNSESKELLLIQDLNALVPALSHLIREVLTATSFIPRITRIDEVDVRFGYQQWKVQTDRGPADFRVQEREDIRFLANGRFRVKDADGNVYDLPNPATLDDHSKKAVETLI
jgi:hypothetical protein